MGIPVLVAVGKSNLPGFLEFASGLAQEIAPSTDAVIAWAEQATTEAA